MEVLLGLYQPYGIGEPPPGTRPRALHGDLPGARTALKDLQLAQPGITLAWVDENVEGTDTVRPRFVEGLRLAGLPE